MQKTSHIIPLLLTVFIAALIVWSGINPSDRAVWYAEIIPVSAVFVALIATYRRFRFSNLAYVFMSFWLIMHTVGAHYTFADVPFDWANRLLAPFLGEGRNHFDRVGHYIIGFYAYPPQTLPTCACPVFLLVLHHERGGGLRNHRMAICGD